MAEQHEIRVTYENYITGGDNQIDEFFSSAYEALARVAELMEIGVEITIRP